MSNYNARLVIKDYLKNKSWKTKRQIQEYMLGVTPHNPDYIGRLLRKMWEQGEIDRMYKVYKGIEYVSYKKI